MLRRYCSITICWPIFSLCYQCPVKRNTATGVRGQYTVAGWPVSVARSVQHLQALVYTRSSPQGRCTSNTQHFQSRVGLQLDCDRSRRKTFRVLRVILSSRVFRSGDIMTFPNTSWCLSFRSYCEESR